MVKDRMTASTSTVSQMSAVSTQAGMGNGELIDVTIAGAVRTVSCVGASAIVTNGSVTLAAAEMRVGTELDITLGWDMRVAVGLTLDVAVGATLVRCVSGAFLSMSVAWT